MVRYLSLGNGSMLTNLDRSLRVRDLYFPYAGQENHVQGQPHRIGIHANGFSWLKEWKTTPQYMEDTILGESRARNDIEGLELVFRDTVDCDRNVFLREITIENKEDYDREIELFFHQNFAMYGNETADTCFYHPRHAGVIHYKKNRYIMAEVKQQDSETDALSQYGIYRTTPSSDIENGSLNNNPIAQGNVQSAISTTIQVAANDSSTLYYWLNTGRNLKGVIELNKTVEENIDTFLLETELCWRGFIGKEGSPEALKEPLAEQFKRSLLVVRGQTNDNGAITAANDSTNLKFNQDKYGYVWPRDAALVADVMAKAGYPEIISSFFDFAEQVIEPDGYFLHKFNPDTSLGSSWHPWIDTKGNERLPIQEDETALTVWAIKSYADETGDTAILTDKWASLIKPAADFLLQYFDNDLHLPKPSYDLWEEKHYISSFTVAAVYAGLKAAEAIAETIGEDGAAYKQKANEIKAKGLENLRSDDTKRYVRGLENGKKLDTVSAPLIFLWKFGLVDEDDEYFQNTINAIRHDLSPDTAIGGIARYKGDHYHNISEDFEQVPGNPWMICTLWLGQYLIQTAETEDELETGKTYLDWANENALNTKLMPEQVNPFTGEGVSVGPLTWSHTTFIETALMYAEKKEELSGAS